MEDTIQYPGKFEGEASYVPDFWMMGLDGMADYDMFNIYGFLLTEEDCKNHAIEAEPGNYLYLWEDAQGFVYAHTQSEPKCVDCESHCEIGDAVCSNCSDTYINVWDCFSVD